MNEVQFYIIYLSLFIESVLGLFLISKVLPVKNNLKSRSGSFLRIGFLLLYFIFQVIQQIYSEKLPVPSYIVYISLHVLFPFLYAWLFHRGSFKLKLFLSLIYASVIMLMAFPATLSVSILTNGSFMIMYMTRLVRFLGDFLAVLFLAHFRFPVDEKYPASYYAVMIVAPIANMSIMFVLMYQSSYSQATDPIGSIIFLLELITYFMMWQSSMEYNRRIQSELLNQQMKSEFQYMENLNDIVKEYHHLRHDTKNHIACMDLLLSQGKYDDLKAYFYTLSQKVYAVDSQIETGNIIVNQVVNMKYVTAQSQNIPLEIHASLPKELEIPAPAICSLLSNLLDNAIEASSQIAEPHIQLDLSMVKCYLAIKISNTIEAWQKESAMKYQTTKGEASLHGFGKQIIEKIADRNEGTVHYECKDDKFIVSVMLLNE